MYILTILFNVYMLPIIITKACICLRFIENILTYLLTYLLWSIFVFKFYSNYSVTYFHWKNSRPCWDLNLGPPWYQADMLPNELSWLGFRLLSKHILLSKKFFSMSHLCSLKKFIFVARALSFSWTNSSSHKLLFKPAVVAEWSMALCNISQLIYRRFLFRWPYKLCLISPNK